MTKNEKGSLTPFGKAVKKKLIDREMLITQLADEVGTSARYLNHIMYGRRSGEKYIQKIAAVLNINLEKFIA